MEPHSLNAQDMRSALASLDRRLPRSVTLMIGGGGAMLLAYDFPLTTTDIDAVPKGLSADELKPFIEQTAVELGLPVDWLNPWFSSFTHVLPPDFADRLVEVFRGERLVGMALGREDLLLMKCFARRQKDIPHARALLAGGADLEVVRARLDHLRRKRIPGAAEAEDFLDEIEDMESE